MHEKEVFFDALKPDFAHQNLPTPAADFARVWNVQKGGVMPVVPCNDACKAMVICSRPKC